MSDHMLISDLIQYFYNVTIHHNINSLLEWKPSGQLILTGETFKIAIQLKHQMQNQSEKKTVCDVESMLK